MMPVPLPTFCIEGLDGHERLCSGSMVAGLFFYTITERKCRKIIVNEDANDLYFASFGRDLEIDDIEDSDITMKERRLRVEFMGD